MVLSSLGRVEGVEQRLLIPDPGVRTVLSGRQNEELVGRVVRSRVGGRENEETVGGSVGVHFEKVFPKTDS